MKRTILIAALAGAMAFIATGETSAQPTAAGLVPLKVGAER